MQHPIKLLVISDYRDYLTSRSEAELLIGLQKEGFLITVMTHPNTPYEEKFALSGIRVLPYHPDKKRDPSAIQKIRTELISGNYQLLLLFNSLASTNGIPAAKKLPVKVILYRGYTGNIHWYDFTLYFKYFHPRVDSIFCINSTIESIFRRNKLFGPHKAVTIIKGHNPSWYESVRPAVLTDFGIPEKSFLITCVANVRPMKGIPVLLKAIQKFPPGLPVHILFIGKGFNQPSIQNMIQKSGYARQVHCLGFINDPLPLVASSSVFVLPSVKGEGLSKSTIEAMSLGVAPVITSIPGNTDLVEHEKSGLLVAPGNADAMSEAIIRLYHDPGLRERLAMAARKRMQEHFHIDKTIQGLKAHFLMLLKQNPQ